MIRVTFPDKTWFVVDDATEFFVEYARLNNAVLSDTTAEQGRALLVLRHFPRVEGNTMLSGETFMWQNLVADHTVSDATLLNLLVKRGFLTVEDVNVVEVKGSVQRDGSCSVLWDKR